MDQGPGASSNSDVPPLEHFERRDGGIAQNPQLMRHAQPAHVLFAAEFGDRARDRIVETPVQGAKVVGTDGRREFNGEVRDRLTDVAVGMHDLADGQPLRQELASVFDCGSAYR